MRTPVAMQISAELTDWIQHLGGEDRLGSDDRVRIERATFMTVKLREHESAVLRGEPEPMTPEQYAAWTNTLNGLVNRIGPRRAKVVRSLKAALEVAP